MEEKREILDQLLNGLKLSAAQMSKMASELGDHDMQNGFQYVYNEGMMDGFKKGYRSGAVLGMAVSAVAVGIAVAGYKVKEYYDTKKTYNLEQEKIRQAMNNTVKQKEAVVIQSDICEVEKK